MELTRRAILRALLGASAAGAPACRRKVEPAYDGALVDPAIGAGHAVRDGPPLVAPPEPEEVPILIAGAGVAGLSAGWELRRRGRHDFLLLEIEGEPGGTAAGGARGKLRFPWGAHYLPAPAKENHELVELLEETGSVIGREPDGAPIFEETHLTAAPKERVYHRGFWYEGLLPRPSLASRDLEQLIRFRAEVSGLVGATGDDGRRAFAIPMERSSEDAAFLALDQLSMAEWMARKGFDSPMLRWYVEYGCRDDFGTELAETSAWAALHYHCARTERPGGESAEFLTWPEGNGFLTAHLAEKVGKERIRTGVAVARIEPAGDGRRAKVIGFDAETRAPRAWLAERVIFALPSFLRRHLLPRSAWPGLAEHHPDYAPWLVANLHLADHPASRGYPECWDNVILGSRSLGYVVATHQRLEARGETVFTWYLPFSGPDPSRSRKDLLSLGWKDAASTAVSELDRVHDDFAAKLRRVDVRRIGHGMVRPTPGSVWSRSRRAAANPHGPLLFAHTDLSALPLFEEAFHHGLRAAHEALSPSG